MLLRDYIVANRNNPERIYVGANTAFFYIGYFYNADTGISKVNREYKNQLNKTLKKLKTELSTAPSRLKDANRLLESAKNDQEKKYAQVRIKTCESTLKNHPKKIEKVTKEIENWKHFLDREVKETHIKDSLPGEKGIVIIVKGNDSGRYWNYSEWKKDHE